MSKKESPSDRFHRQMVAAIESSGQTHYGIGQFWSAEIDDNPGTLTKKLDRWVDKQPKTITDMICLLDSLGYDVEIRKR